MNENLKDVFLNVNEWLKFAEAKNAALIVFNLGSIFGALTIITQTDCPITIPQLALAYIFSFIIFNFFGLVIALFSFWPQTQKLFKNEKIDDNLFYYGHIEKHEYLKYLKNLNEACNKREGKEYSNLESSYASQILINSKITSRKYLYFKYALFCTISALLTPIITVPLVFLFMANNWRIREKKVTSLMYFITFILVLILACKISLILWKVLILILHQ